MWYVFMKFDNEFVLLPTTDTSRENLEWQIATWKQEMGMTKDPFHYKYVPIDNNTTTVKEHLERVQYTLNSFLQEMAKEEQ